MALERKDIDPKYKWDLSVIYKDKEAFSADYKLAERKIKDFSKHEKKMLLSPENLADALDDTCEIDTLIEKLWCYAHLNFSVDTSDNFFQAESARVRNLAVMAGSASWFVTPYILRLDEATVDDWIASCERLKTYSRILKKTMRAKAHTLSDECEKLMSGVADCLGGHSDIRSIFANSDMRFGKIRVEDGKRVELTDSNYPVYMRSLDRRVRMAAFKEMYRVYGQFSNTFATIYDGRVKEFTTLAKLRGYKDSLTASTYRDELTPEIYNNLIKTVESSLEPLYDYYDLKREVLGLDKLHLYDIYTPLVGEFNRKYSYEEAVDEVLKTVKVYGEEYYNTLKDGLCERGWVDVYPNRGKRGGAFSSGCPSTEPYMLLNYTDNYDDVATLAHEAGHSMHTWFSNQHNEPHNAGYTLFVAEVASTVNELLLAHRKLDECKSDEEKLYILNQLMETYKATLYRQVMFASFEKEMHALCEKGEPLTSDVISRRYYRLVRKYFGKGVVCDKQIALEWARVPHFFTCFYVYKYATSISAASAIVKRIESEGEAYVGKYIDFLKCGDSKSPLDSLLVAGIDMRDPAVIKDAIEDFAKSVRLFRDIYNKTKNAEK